MTPSLPYHIPVMLAECLQHLALDPAGTYVDLTFGGGGHSRAIWQQLGPQGRLFSFDKDPAAKANTEGFDERFTLIEADFRHLERYLKLHGVTQVDGILADLGVSSHQFDTPERGFSIRYEGALDMRMDTTQGPTAAELLKTASEIELRQWFRLYGEVENPHKVASAIIRERTLRDIETTAQLVNLLTPLAPRNREYKYQAQVFQALRIVVNDELDSLKEMLEQSARVLRPEGRLVVMSYHSLEDRLVKNFIAKGNFEGDDHKDLFGNPIRPFDPGTRKPIEASDDEIAQNNRARSARLRVGIRRA